MRNAMVLMVVVALCAVLYSQAAPVTARGSDPSEPRTTGKSKTWRVVVESAEKYTWPLPDIDQYGPPADEFNLALNLTIEYVGSDAEVKAPRVAVLDEKGKEYAMRSAVTVASSDLNALDWLRSAAGNQPRTMAVKTGQKFGKKAPVTYYLAGIPKSSRELKLRLGDVPPFVIHPLQKNKK